MAIAGRVAIVPKDAYDSTVAYQKLDLVRYNHNVYIAKKSSTGILPTDEEYWMLAIENVTQEQYEAIVNGTTAVGNALKVNGHTFYNDFTQIDGAFSQDTPIVDVVSKMAPDSKLCVTIYASTSGIYPSGNGVLEIDKHNVNGNFTAVKFTDRNNGKLYTSVVQLDTFVGWAYSADGGDADTVDGYHVGGNGLKGLVALDENYGIMEIGRTIDFHTTDGQDFTVRLSAADDGSLWLNFPSGEAVRLGTTEDLANYLNLNTGGTVKGAIIADNGTSYAGFQSRRTDTNGDVYTAQFWSGGNMALIGLLKKSVGETTNTSLAELVLTENGFGLKLNGESNTVIHSGNVGSYAVYYGTSAPNSTAPIWVDTANKVIKAYIDGAWTALA